MDPSSAAPLLPRTPEEGARRLALGFLDEAEAALPRLADPDDSDGSDDTEGLHDFRVALRRLRSALRSYRDALSGSVPKKLARRLGKLAGATNPGRDAEVQLEWLAIAGKQLGWSGRPGLAWLEERLAGQKREAYGEIAERLAGDFAKLAEKLRRRLSVYEVALLPAGVAAPTFAAETARILTRQGGELADLLAQVGDADDIEEAHEARIAGKRLRYLLDPLSPERPEAAQLVKRLKKLQDLLGELHDSHVLEETLRNAVEEAAGERARHLFALSLEDAPVGELRAARRRAVEPGLLALAKANRARRDLLFAEMREGWLDGKAEAFLADVATLAGQLAGEK